MGVGGWLGRERGLPEGIIIDKVLDVNPVSYLHILLRTEIFVSLLQTILVIILFIQIYKTCKYLRDFIFQISFGNHSLKRKKNNALQFCFSNLKPYKQHKCFIKAL